MTLQQKAPLIVGFAGMTHLGLNSAVATAEKGFQVVCFDPDPDRIKAINSGRLPVVEPDLPELLARNSERLSFSSDIKDIERCQVIYVAPDVPTDDRGESDLTPVRKMIEHVDDGIGEGCVLVILSQVDPGFTRQLGRDPELTYYQVETLIFGRAIERALYPERYIIGCADPAEPLPSAFASLLKAFNCPILPMRYESAELAKISINMFLVASVTTSNTLAEICEEIGADWSEIVPALKLDKRIGRHAYLAPGLGIAGGNLERDLASVVRMGDEHGTDVGTVRAWRFNSKYRRYWALHKLHDKVLAANPDALIAVLGLAYKIDTDSTKNSPSLALLEALYPFKVRAFDPVVKPRPQWHPTLIDADGPIDACHNADALVIMTPWEQFRKLDPKEIAAALAGKIVIDPYGALDAAACAAAGLEHHRLGA